MAGITAATAQTNLDLWLAADAAVAVGQEFSHNGRSFKRADAEQIRANISFWDDKVKRLSRGGIRIRGAVPIG